MRRALAISRIFKWSKAIPTLFHVSVLPFGLATACYVFTYLLRPLVKRWRSNGLKAIVYVDDGICAASSESQAEVARDCIVVDLRRAGFY